MKHHLLPVSPKTMHWGYFSKKVAPSLTLKSGDRATIETLTHHANDDYERMIADDPGAEAVFHWTREQKTMARRGYAPRNLPKSGPNPLALLPDLVYRPWSLEGDRIESRDISGSLPVVQVGMVWRRGSGLPQAARDFVGLAQSQRTVRQRL